MKGLRRTDPPDSSRLSRKTRAFWMLWVSLICLFGGWYYGFAVLPRGIASLGGIVTPDLYPAWYASRVALLEGKNPYSAEVAAHNRLVIYGRSDFPSGLLVSGHSVDQQRFAYPLWAVLVFAPLAILPFGAAQATAVGIFLALTVLSVYWWTSGRLSRTELLSLTFLVLGAYPIAFALMVVQPTLLAGGLLAAAFGCIKSGRLTLAGVLGALATVKPQLAAGILLPLVIWTLHDWRSRKRFFISLALALTVLVAAAEVMQPRWIFDWVSTVRVYTTYTTVPLLTWAVGRSLAIAGGVILAGMIVWVAARWSETDLLFAVSFSAAALLLLFPTQVYNEIILVPAFSWIFINAGEFKRRNYVQELLFLAVCAMLVLIFSTMIAASSVSLFSPKLGLTLWKFPAAVFILHLPIALVLFLISCATASPASLRAVGCNPA